MTDCTFCRIVAGSLPASFVYRDDRVSAFLDIRPINPGHVLVVPNRHAVHTHDVPKATADHMFGVARRLARALRSPDAVGAQGTNLLVADGEAANQEVLHAHVHVVPRYEGDGFVIDAPHWRDQAPDRDALDAQAARIRHALERDNGGVPEAGRD